MAEILIIDDDPIISRLLSRLCAQLGHRCVCGASKKEGLKLAGNHEFDLVLLDVHLPDGNGLEAVPRFSQMLSSPEVIIITGKGDANGAEAAIRYGAWDYIEKPASMQEMTLPIVRAIKYRNEKCHPRHASILRRKEIVGHSPQLTASLERLAEAACSDVNVLIQGESGTGKELFARAIHGNSGRQSGNFIVVDCAALPETLTESILFGHQRGAFTGAERSQDGLILQADQGTLFLDEIGELPLSIQKSFLRVLQERQFRPVGGHRVVESNFRLIAATNKDLEASVRDGLFREDLLFRLRAYCLSLPPLREREGDVQELAFSQISQLCHRYQTNIKGFSPDFLEALGQYDWPGNVRELVNAMERAFSSAINEPILYPKHLPEHIRIRIVKKSLRLPAVESSPHCENETAAPSPLLNWLDTKERLEKEYMDRLMEESSGQVSRACVLSGLSRARLYALLKKYRLGGRGVKIGNQAG